MSEISETVAGPGGADASARRLTQDIRSMWLDARERGTESSLRDLHRRAFASAGGAILFDWGVIAAAFAAVLAFGVAAFPAALLLVGNRQRALSVLIHDASHGTLHPHRNVNDTVARLLLCWPMLVSLAHYRAVHEAHHRYLGVPERDGDYLHSEERVGTGWWRIYGGRVLSPAEVWSNVRGGIGRTSWRSALVMVAWWTVVLSALAVAAGPHAAFVFASLWLAARATVYHAIISFVIISDHVGLRPGTILGFARNHPARGLGRWLIHPHANGRHLTHHLLPGVPFHALDRAHALLSGWSPYAAAAHCDTYLLGPNSVIRSWGRRAVRPPAP